MAKQLQSAPQLVVGSANPTKINAATRAVQRCLPHLQTVHGIEVPSLVRPQPIGDEETLRGAVNRVQALASAWRKQQGVLGQCSRDSLLLAVEGGVVERNGDLWCFAFAAARLAGGAKVSTARSAEFLLPRQLAELVLEQGMELGAADDLVFGRTSSGQGSGTVGHLTRNLVTRADYYEHCVCICLIPFMNPTLYREYALPPVAAEE